MELTMLGTGHATVTRCYNTCLALSDGDRYFLVDAGGGNGILRILEEQGIPLTAIHDLFLSHGHTDHVLGAVWVIRMVGQLICQGRYPGTLSVYCHRELAETVAAICRMTLMEKITGLFGGPIRFDIVEDGDRREILGREARFFDIRSKKLRQFGFRYAYHPGGRLVFCGDEPLGQELEGQAAGADWLLHEAFCLYAERERFHPYEKSHSTVRDACILAERLGVGHLLLYHTEDTHLPERQALYTAEGRQFYRGELLVPPDGARLTLD